MRRELHRISGTAGSFGFTEASILAGAFEERAVRWSGDPTFEREQRETNLRRFIAALDALLSETPAEDVSDDEEPLPPTQAKACPVCGNAMSDHDVERRADRPTQLHCPA